MRGEQILSCLVTDPLINAGSSTTFFEITNSTDLKFFLRRKFRKLENLENFGSQFLGPGSQVPGPGPGSQFWVPHFGTTNGTVRYLLDLALWGPSQVGPWGTQDTGDPETLESETLGTSERWGPATLCDYLFHLIKYRRSSFVLQGWQIVL